MPGLPKIQYLSISDVASVLRVSRWTVSRMLDDGVLPHIPVRGAPRIDPADLMAWIAAEKAKSVQRAKQRAQERAKLTVVSGRRGRPRKSPVGGAADDVR
ncbi:helix-turn-helix domain-containing protein [Paramagnetospirillum marisnigri]|uniref:helix-turn-helix domain-containing protein n=1 Tax=Paramagnetospirillum marisnigri TaxID=1285242 RepID=UPI0009EEB7AB